MLLRGSSIYTLMAEYISSEENGLLLMCPPTGSGKSYYAQLFIADFISKNPSVPMVKDFAETDPDRKIIYATPLIKNLPSDRDIAQASGLSEEFVASKTLRLPRAIDPVLKYFPLFFERNAGNLPDLSLFRRTAAANEKAFSALASAIRAYTSALQKAALMPQEYVSLCLDKVVSAELKVRAAVKKALSAPFEGIPAKNIAHEIERPGSPWHWVGMLYPSVYIPIRQVIFLTVKKLFMRIDPIIEKPFCFYDADCSYAEGAVVIYDEFDAAKPDMLDAIIQGDCRKVDFIHVFTEIYGQMVRSGDECPLDKHVFMTDKMKERYKELRTEADRLYEKYHIRSAYKTRENLQGESRGFIFRDFGALLTMDGSGFSSSVCCKYDEDENTNHIDIKKRGEGKENTDASEDECGLGEVISDLETFIRRFESFAWRAALRYRDQKNAGAGAEKRSEKQSISESVYTVLSLFRLGSGSREYLHDRILIRMYEKPGAGAGSVGTPGKRNIYSAGFSYSVLLDGPDHDRQTDVIYYSYLKFPEQYLLRMCRKAKVIGISATGSLKSTGNFDLDFLRSELGEAFHSPAERGNEYHPEKYEELYNGIDREFEKSISGYEGHGEPEGRKVRVNSCLVPGIGDRGAEAAFSELMQKEDAAALVQRILLDCRGAGRSGVHFAMDRYFRIGYAYREFLLHDDILSFLCIVNKLPKYQDGFDFNSYRLRDMFAEIFRSIKGADPHGTAYFLLHAEVNPETGEDKNFERKLSDLKGRLSAGEKIFVISTYKTIGSGQNLQYEIPEFLKGKLIQTGERTGDKKDFDAAYFETPTHLILRLNPWDEIKESDFIGFLYQNEYMEQYGEIGRGIKRGLAQLGFRRYYCGEYGSKQDAYLLNSIAEKRCVRNSATQILCQAVGRMCRTGMKQENVYLYAASGIGEALGDEMPGRALNPEFVSLVNAASAGSADAEKKKEERFKNLDKKSFEYACARANRSAKAFISDCMPKKGAEYFWDDEMMRMWEKLRGLVLRVPSANADLYRSLSEEERYLLEDLYLDLKLSGGEAAFVYYRESGDFKDVDVFMSDRRGEFSFVSPETSNLTAALRCASVRKHFEKMGYALDFVPGRFVMTPVLAVSIYMGAVGEQAGLAVFEDLSGLSLHGITDGHIYEYMDFKVSGRNAYIDFKNRGCEDPQSSEKELRKLKEKLLAIPECETACIINLIADTKAGASVRDFEVSDERKVKLITIPSLLDYKDSSKVRSDAAEILVKEFKQ